MNRKLIMFSALLFGAAGGYLPVLLGDTEFFDGWGLLGGLCGGLFGVWVGVVVSKRWG